MKKSKTFSLREIFQRFKKWRTDRHEKAELAEIMKVLWAADRTSDVQGVRFFRLVPKMHKYYESRDFINEYGHIAEAYCEDVICLGVSEEVEMAFICDNDPAKPWITRTKNTLWYLHRNGHEFSPKAREEMKKRCPDTYKLMYPED